jgi:hypothetical protein
MRENHQVITTTQITSNDDIETISTRLVDEINHALEKSTIKFTTSFSVKPIETISEELVKLIKFNRKIKRLYKRTNNPNHKKFYNFLERNLKRRLTEFKNEKINNEFNELKSFNQSVSKHWKLIKKLENIDEPKQSKEQAFKSNDTVIKDNAEIANLFADNLAKTFDEKTTDKPSTRSFTSSQDTSIDYISTSELHNSIKNLNAKASPGFDKISNKVIKNLPLPVLGSILNLFNSSLRLSYIPYSWKKSKITMILKKNKPADDFESYRPISLLSCIGKLMEKIINDKIQKWAELNKLLPACQAGFRSNRSTQEHILRLNQAIIDGFNHKMLTGAIFFDLEKAFDKASHYGILHKLQEKGLSQNLLNWIKNFLSNRKFQVCYKGQLSEAKDIKTGVSQGSCLSSTIFNLFFSDKADHIPIEVKIALFADDLCVWSTQKTKKKIEK